MARPLRTDSPGAMHHVTSRGNNKGDIFYDDEDRLHFLALLAETVLRFGWHLYAWVLMANHFHLQIETPEANLSRGMHWLNGRYAQWFNRRHGRCGHLYQGRFDAKLIERESHFLNVARYIVLNPVRAHLVERPEDYRWSSYHSTAGLESAPVWLDARDLLSAFGKAPKAAREEYRRFVAGGIGIEQSIWDDLVGQIYLGSAEWIDRVQSMIDEEPRSDEHPREQRNPGRPEMQDVMEAVAATCDVTGEQIRERSAATARQVAAWLAFEEGLVRQSEIAAALGVGRSTISALVSACRRASGDDPIRELIEAARGRMKRRMPKWTPPPAEFSLPFHRKRRWIPGNP